MSRLRAVDIDGVYHDVDVADVSWRVHVYGVVLDGDKILLSPQHHDNGYDLPGGKVDLDETLEAALIREVCEETGIDIDVVRQLAVRDNFFKVTFREPQETWHSVMIYYLCRPIGGTISADGFDDDEKNYADLAEWVDINRLDDISPAASYDWREIVRQATKSND